MTLDEIEADVLYTLTDIQRRLFMAAGCEPACHSCNRDIAIGDNFHLVTHPDRGRDIMLCSKCDIKKLKRNQAQRLRRWRKANRHRGFTRPSKYIT